LLPSKANIKLPPYITYGGIIFIFYNISNSPKAASDDLTCGRDDGERIGVDLLDSLTQTDRVNAVADGVDHRLIRTAEAADDLVGGDAVVQLGDNVFGDLVRLFGDDDKVFTAVDIINDAVHEERLCEKTYQREQSDLHAERDKGAQTDQKVGIEKCLSDVQTGVFFEDQRHDIRAAGGSRLREHDRGACRRQNDGVNELKKGLRCQRCADGNDLLEDHGEEGKRKTAIRRADSRFPADEDEADDKEQDIDHGDPRCGGQDRERLTEYRTDTADTARDESVWDLEEIDTERQ